jgi:hypothetical protein
MTQTADGPVGFENCLKLDCTTADTSIAAGEYLAINNFFESQNCVRIGSGTSAAKKVSVSFYVKGNASATYVVQLLNNNHSSYIHNNRTFAVTTDWVRHEITFQADTTTDSAFDSGATAGLGITFILHAGSNFTSATLASDWATGVTNRAAGISSFFDSTDRTFFLTGVQVEVGEAATPFEHKTFAEDLEDCQRYFYRHGGAVGEVIGDMLPSNASSGAITVLNPVELRADPSVTILNLRVHDTATVHAVTAIQVRNDLSANRRFMYFVTTVGGGGMTGFRPMVAAIDGSSAGYLELDAEL